MSSERQAPRDRRGIGPRVLLVGVLLTMSCARDIRPFPLAEPMWVDEGDTSPFTPPPAEYFSPFAWDGADQMVFRPLAQAFKVEAPAEAVNVNAMDEVPNSSWFVNRLTRQTLALDQILAAACDEPPLDPSGQWMITNAKPNGANPGFIIEDERGRKFLLKFDSPRQPERATSADVMGSILYWAAGYHTPCNRIVYFDREILSIEPGATAEVDGEDVPMTWELLEPAFGKATRTEDGLFRAASSRFLPGRPIGPWRYEGVRQDDANDVVPHEERRELRGAYVLTSWINHFDSREQNTLAMWIEGEEGGGHVRHNYIDWGDSFGSMWSVRGISERLGHSSYFDLGHVTADFLSLGLIPRPWRNNHLGPTGETLGYFNVETFVPDRYRPGYPNPAFLRATERDNAWMARIIADITPETVEAIVGEAKLLNRLVHSELVRILQGRRLRLLQRWLRRLSPLTWPRVEPTQDGARLCLRDMAVAARIVDPRSRAYWARAYRYRGGSHVEPLPVGDMVRLRPDWMCVEVPSVDSASADAPAYLIVDVTGLFGPDDDESRPARVHMYQTGSTQYRVVGLERPYGLAPPGRR